MSSLLNLPGNIVRGAGNVVGGTVSAVANAAGVGNRHKSDAGEMSLKEKVVLNVKESPAKDAVTTGNLAVRTGFIMKRNEQGVWQRRYCCMVPHMFLYYFENETADAPRGIIDLEYFTDIDIQSENILKLSTPPYINSRPFFFQINDPNMMSEWMGAIHRDRYMVVRDERDAYQQLQDQFSGQMDFATKMMEENGIEKERMVSEISTIQRQLNVALRSLHGVLEALANNGEEVSNEPESVLAASAGLSQKLNAMKAEYESQVKSLIEENQSKVDSLEDRIEELQKLNAAEIHAKRMLEAQCTQDKRDNDLRHREALAQIEKANQNYQVVWSIKSSHEDKLNVAAEQKRVLVKEVKNLRKKTDDLSAHNDSLSEVNAKLESAVSALQAELERKQIDFDERLAAATATAATTVLDQGNDAEAERNSSAAEAESDEGQEGSSMNQALEAMRISAEVKKSNSENAKGSSGPTSSASQIIDEVAGSSSAAGVSSHTGSSSGILPPPPSTVDPEGNAIDWEVANRSSLLNLDWLSPQQRQLVEERQRDEIFLGQGEQQERKKSLIGDFTSSLFKDKEEEENSPAPKDEGTPKISMKRFSAIFHKGLDGSSHHGSDGTGDIDGAAHSNDHEHHEAPDHEEDSKLSLKRFSAIFHKGPDHEAPIEDGSTHTSATATHTDSSDNDIARINEAVNADGKPRCYRCGGTVEGPKYSTCKCDIPMMTPDEGNAIDHFKGFFSKGKRSAGGLADGMKKKAGSIFSSGGAHGGGHMGQGSGHGSDHMPDRNASGGTAMSDSQPPLSAESTSWLDSFKSELNAPHDDILPPASPEHGSSPKKTGVLLSLDEKDSDDDDDYHHHHEESEKL